jgi:hypothetical protein
MNKKGFIKFLSLLSIVISYNLFLIFDSSFLQLINLSEFGFKFGLKFSKKLFNDKFIPNLTFVSGGFLSLDGYHPNQKGYALIANEFIKAINTKYKANVPYTTCKSCDGVLFN